ncbi:MAG: ribonuclease HII [Patescibacteria group bacterium]
MKNILFTLGIDEAGRGPLAGPVAIGVVKVHKGHEATLKKLVKDIKGRDSKKLSPAKREEWFEKIKAFKKQGILDFHVALVPVQHIDEKGIAHAIRFGMKMCLRKVKADHTRSFVKLDGSLKAPQEFISQKTIIKGDEKEWIIGLASIAAKVSRDTYMIRQGKNALYKPYKLEIHKGYGTKVHRELIVKYGPSSLHRLSFLKNIVK